MNKLESAAALDRVGPESRIASEITQLALYRKYKRAFVEATGLQLRLVQFGAGQPEPFENVGGNPFCKLLFTGSQSCSACNHVQRKLTASDGTGPLTQRCFAGFFESSIPIRNGRQTIGYLLTGQVATRRPTAKGFSQILGQLRGLGVHVDEDELRRTYFATPVISPEKYRALIDLLVIFAGHLSMVAGQLAIHEHDSDAPNITEAKRFIEEHLTEPMDLKTVAAKAHLSSCYFCKRFKASTGYTFTEYVSRIRVEAAKSRLVSPSARISEVAYEVGFQSLTHFNRVFKEVVGKSPTRYRKELPSAELGTS